MSGDTTKQRRLESPTWDVQRTKNLAREGVV